MRDTWMLLLFIGGLLVGVAAGAAYNFVKVKSFVQTIEASEREVTDLKKQLKREQTITTEAKDQAAKRFDALQREYDALQVELAEQKRIAALQREQLAKRIEPEAEGDSTAGAIVAEEVEPEPSALEEGRVRGGKLVYRKLKMSRLRDEFEIKGEIENRSGKKYSSAYFHIDLYGKGREPVDKFVVTMFNLAPSETRTFEERASADRPAITNEVRRWQITAALLVEEK